MDSSPWHIVAVVLVTNDMASLTVLICTHNRVDLLDKTLASLNAARKPVDWRVGVLVAANACTDDTHEFLGE